MDVKVNVNDLIETIVEMTVEHYVDETRKPNPDNIYAEPIVTRTISNENVDSMKADLIKKLSNIFSGGN